MGESNRQQTGVLINCTHAHKDEGEGADELGHALLEQLLVHCGLVDGVVAGAVGLICTEAAGAAPVPALLGGLVFVTVMGTGLVGVIFAIVVVGGAGVMVVVVDAGGALVLASSGYFSIKSARRMPASEPMPLCVPAAANSL